HATDRSMEVASLARAVEERGLHSLYLPEHTHIPVSRRTPPPTGDAELAERYKRTPDPLVALAVAAAVTERIRLGTGICVIAQRQDPVRRRGRARVAPPAARGLRGNRARSREPAHRGVRRPPRPREGRLLRVAGRGGDGAERAVGRRRRGAPGPRPLRRAGLIAPELRRALLQEGGDALLRVVDLAGWRRP